AAACARRYGRPVAAVLAARTRWMAHLFETAHPERRAPAEDATDKDAEERDDGPAVDKAATTTCSVPAAAAGAHATADEPAVERAAAGMGPGSQPILGLPVTCAGPQGVGRARRSRRRKRLTVPQGSPGTSHSGSASIAADPLPLPVAEEPVPRQLPLLRDGDAH